VLLQPQRTLTRQLRLRAQALQQVPQRPVPQQQEPDLQLQAPEQREPLQLLGL